MRSTDPVILARNRLAFLHQPGRNPAPGAITEARRDLVAARAERAICAALADDLPPTPEQRERLAALLTGGADRG